MLKYVDTKVTFSEVPDEITLCINLSNCPCKCKNCHSSYLAEDIGEELNEDSLRNIIESNNGISCVSLMGGDAEPNEVRHLAMFMKEEFPHLKVAWYSGKEELPFLIKLNLHNFDFIKLGPYKEECGPLNKRTTNQRFYKVFHFRSGVSKLIDTTYKFWNKKYDEDED